MMHVKFSLTLGLFLLVSACSLLEPVNNKKPDPVEVRFQVPETKPPPVPPPARPGFVSFEATEESVIADLNAILSNVQRNETRYADGCDRFNSGEELIEYKKGVDKALNSLSTRNDVVLSVPVGAGCMFRYDKSDYGISDEEYRKLEDRTVLQIPRLPNGQLANISTRGLTIQALTNTLRPILHGDDLILAAMEGDQLTDFGGDTYLDIIEQEVNGVDFLANEQVNIQVQFDDQTALMGGVNNSGVAFGSRLIVMLESINGRIRYSEDSSNVEPDNVNENPFVVAAAFALRDGDVERILRSVKIFRPVAREYIYDLPNGAHAYRIEEAGSYGGVGISVVPGNVALSGRHAALGIDGQIRPSMCMECHNKGTEGWTDTVADHVKNIGNFNSDEKTIATDFMNRTRIQQFNARVDTSYAQFLGQIGLSPRDRDPVNGRLLNPFRGEITVEAAAAKFRLTTQQYIDCLNGSLQSPQFLGSHLNGGTVSLTDFSAAYPIVVEECNLFEDS